MIPAWLKATVSQMPLMQAVEEADPRQLDWVGAYATVTADPPEQSEAENVE